MRQHIISGVIAAAISTAVIAVAPPKVTQVTHAVMASKHAWPALTDSEKRALGDVLKTLPKTTKFDIVCNDASCTDLAMDIDDAMEAAGLESVLDHAIGPLGYGIALRVSAFDSKLAEQASAALKQATNGRIDVPVTVTEAKAVAPGYVTILIGKYRPAAR